MADAKLFSESARDLTHSCKRGQEQADNVSQQEERPKSSGMSSARRATDGIRDSRGRRRR